MRVRSPILSPREVAFLLSMGAAIAGLTLMRNSYLIHLGVLAVLYAYLGSSWNLVAGYTGQFSFGHAAFFGLGAYLSTLLFTHLGISPWLGALAGGLIAALLGLFEGYLCFRYGLKGWYFALTTWAFAEALRVVALNLGPGAAGMIIPLRPDLPSLLTLQFSGAAPYLWLSFVFLVGVLLLTRFIERTRFGLNCLAVRENEDAAEAAGVRSGLTKIISLGLSAFLTAQGGTLYAQYLMYVDPNLAFGMPVTIEMIVRSVVGGVGTVWGPFVGSLILTPLGEIANKALGGVVVGGNLVLYGAVLIVAVLYAPSGLLRLNWRFGLRRGMESKVVRSS